MTVYVYRILLRNTGFTKTPWVLQEADADAAFEEPTVYWVTRPMKDQKMRLQNWAGKAFQASCGSDTREKKRGKETEFGRELSCQKADLANLQPRQIPSLEKYCVRRTHIGQE